MTTRGRSGVEPEPTALPGGDRCTRHVLLVSGHHGSARLPTSTRTWSTANVSQLFTASVAVKLSTKCWCHVVRDAAFPALGLDRVKTLRVAFGNVCQSHHLFRRCHSSTFCQRTSTCGAFKTKSCLLYANRTVVYYSKFTCIRQAAMLQKLACLCNRPNTLKCRGGRALVYVAIRPVLDG